jgi:hypothetical protein
MGTRAVLVALLAALACAHKPPPPASETFAPQNDTPPPRGLPPPRAGDYPQLQAPNPGLEPGDVTEQERRFPVVQGEAKIEARKRERLHAAGDVELEPGTPIADVCDDVSPEDRLSCPVHQSAVAGVRDIPGGVVIRLRAGRATAHRLSRALECQRAMAQASPRDPPLCPFLDGKTSTRVVAHGSRVEVEVARAGDVDLLREQVHGFAR